jgi:hypothetical protein
MKSIKIEDDKLKNLNIERDDELMLTAHVKNHTIYEKLVVDKGAWDVASRLVLKNGAKLSVEGVMFCGYVTDAQGDIVQRPYDSPCDCIFGIGNRAELNISGIMHLGEVNRWNNNDIIDHINVEDGGVLSFL